MALAPPSFPSSEPDSGQHDALWRCIEPRWRSHPRLLAGSVALGLLLWIPLAIGALLNGSFFPSPDGESLLQHFGTNFRYLLSVPLLVVGTKVTHDVVSYILRRLASDGVLAQESRASFDALIDQTFKLMGGRVALICLGIPFLASMAYRASNITRDHEFVWAIHTTLDSTHSSFGMWALVLFSGPISTLLVLHWFWQVAVVSLFFHRLIKLPLNFVPTHPDAAMGLAAVRLLPQAFYPGALAISTTIVGRWSHNVFIHDAPLTDLKMPLSVTLIVLLLVIHAPLLRLALVLPRVKRKALQDYGRLVTRHGHLVRDKWIDHKLVTNEGLLDAPELGPTVDVNSIYLAIAEADTFLLDKKILGTSVIILSLPMLVLLALKVPIGATLVKVAAALI